MSSAMFEALVVVVGLAVFGVAMAAFLDAMGE